MCLDPTKVCQSQIPFKEPDMPPKKRINKNKPVDTANGLEHFL